MGFFFSHPALAERRKQHGFTLAELLISLVILGVIATFTIPKILQSQQNQQLNAVAKEDAALLSQAVAAYKNQNGLSAATGTDNLVPYINYIRQESRSSWLVDDVNGTTTNCGAATCLMLANGSVVWFWGGITFAGTGNLNAIYYHVDPDGQASANKAINFFVYANGRVRSEGDIEPNTVTSDFTRSPNPALNPVWWNNWN